MQTRSVNGFTAQQVDDALRGVHTGSLEYRCRFELLDQDNAVVRTIENIVDGVVRQNVDQLIKRTAHFTIKEADLDLSPYAEQIVDDGALFYWRMGEASGTNANDATDNNRDGTYTGTVGYNQTSLLPGVTDNGAILFNGTTTSIFIADAAWMDVTNISVEAWIKTTVTGSTRNIASRDNTTTQQMWQLRLTSTGLLELVLWFGATPAVFTSAVNVADGLPHHVLATYNGTHAILYVDSVRVLKTAETRTLNIGAFQIEVGSVAGGTGQFFSGYLDEVGFYGYGLSSAQVRNHYQSGVDDLNEIDYLRDRIKPYIAVKMEENGTDGTPWAEFPVGVFVLANPRRAADETGIYRDVGGFDQSVILLNDRVATRYTVLSGVNYITAVQTVLTSAGFLVANLALTATSLTLPSTREWIIGTAKLDIVNDLLNAANYRPLWFNGNGQAVAEPYVLPASRVSEITYRADSQSMIQPEIELTTNLFEIPNKVILARTNPKTGNLLGTATNTAISSPTSTVRTGRTTTYFDGNIDAADQATITALAKRVLTEKSQIYQDVRLKTWLAPYHEDQDYITLVDPSLDISAGYIEYEWVLPLVEIGDMEHLLRYVVSVV